MTANRRADLQRKLAMVPVPKPPAGLADRIKNEIPKELRFNADTERARLSSSVAFSIRVAASIIVLISSAYFGLRLLSRASEEPPRPAARQIHKTPTSVVAAVPQQKVEEAKPAPTTRAKRPVVTAVASLDKKVELRDELQRLPAAPPQTPVARGASDIAATAQAPVMERVMARRQMAAKSAAIDVVQRFAAPLSVEPARIALDVEATEEAVPPHRVVVRASFDCGALVHDVRFDVIPTADARWLAGSARWVAPEMANTSRSTIVDMPLPTDDAPIATVRVFYRIGSDAAEQSIEKVIRKADIKAWSEASRRTKGAALAALWAMGGDPNAIAAAARAAGIPELAADVER